LTILSCEMVQSAVHVELYNLKHLVVVWFTGGFLAGNLLFYRRGFGLVISVVVPSMLAVLPYARGRGFDSRSRL
jgi:hypothetical protein